MQHIYKGFAGTAKPPPQTLSKHGVRFKIGAGPLFLLPAPVSGAGKSETLLRVAPEDGAPSFFAPKLKRTLSMLNNRFTLL